MCQKCLSTPEGARLWKDYEQANLRHSALQERDYQNKVDKNNPPPDTLAAQQEEVLTRDAYSAFHTQYMERRGMAERQQPGQYGYVPPTRNPQVFPGVGERLKEDGDA